MFQQPFLQIRPMPERKRCLLSLVTKDQKYRAHDLHTYPGSIKEDLTGLLEHWNDYPPAWISIIFHYPYWHWQNDFGSELIDCLRELGIPIVTQISDLHHPGSHLMDKDTIAERMRLVDTDYFHLLYNINYVTKDSLHKPTFWLPCTERTPKGWNPKGDLQHEVINEVFFQGYLNSLRAIFVEDLFSDQGAFDINFRYTRVRDTFLETIRQIARYTIGLNLVRGEEFSVRYFQTLASGSMLLTEHVNKVDRILDDGENCVIWHTPEELIEKANYYLANEQETLRIANNGHELWRTKMCFDKTNQHIEEFLLENKPMPEWSDVI